MSIGAYRGVFFCFVSVALLVTTVATHNKQQHIGCSLLQSPHPRLVGYLCASSSLT